MLILSRKRDDKIDLFWNGEHIVLTVCAVDMVDGVVKLGIEAPDDVRILRREVTRRQYQQEREHPWDLKR